VARGRLIRGLAHVGVRVHDLDRSRAFYERLGFRLTHGPAGPEPVAVLVHPAGIELNLILNAPVASEANILMDVPVKHAGITHFALRVDDPAAVEAALAETGVPLSGRRGDPLAAVFVRDPDGTVIEFACD
jgi:lactoylglutathione lyase